MYQPLDGPSAQSAISVTNSSVVEAKVGSSALAERKALTIQPVGGDLYVYFGDGTGTTPSAATVAANGLIIYDGQKDSYEATNSQQVYILSVSGTISAVIVERA